MKRILITGKNSYIGSKVKQHLLQYEGEYEVNELDMESPSWDAFDFSSYDVVFHVAGIVHLDISNLSEQQKNRYFEVNRDLAISCALIAKEAGVKHFIFMSTMAVYGAPARLGIRKVIHRDTKPEPCDVYGVSKLEAEIGLQALSNDHFQICIIRPPMIYGPDCKGNYNSLRKLALRFLLFPKIENLRSMLYIGNFCCYLKFYIDEIVAGIVFPQNPEYVCTSVLAKEIAKVHGKKLFCTSILNPLLYIVAKGNGKYATLCNKAFGSLIYSYDLSEYHIGMINFEQSIRETELQGMEAP